MGAENGFVMGWLICYIFLVNFLITPWFFVQFGPTSLVWALITAFGALLFSYWVAVDSDAINELGERLEKLEKKAST